MNRYKMRVTILSWIVLTCILHSSNAAALHAADLKNTDTNWEYVSAMLEVFDDDVRHLKLTMETVLANEGVEDCLKEVILNYHWYPVIYNLDNSLWGLKNEATGHYFSRNSTARLENWIDYEMDRFIENTSEELINIPFVIRSTIIVIMDNFKTNIKEFNKVLNSILPALGWQGVPAKIGEIYNASSSSIEQILTIAKSDNEEVGRNIEAVVANRFSYIDLNYVTTENEIEKQCFTLGSARNFVYLFNNLFKEIRKLDANDFSKLFPSVREEVMRILTSSVIRLNEMGEELYALLVNH